MPKDATIFQAKTFTSSQYPTLGNPAGVVLLNEALSEAEMAEIASKVKLPMTAYVLGTEKENEFILRYFDLEGQECHICGHATVATTQILIDQFPALINNNLRFFLNPKFFGGRDEILETTIDPTGKISISLPASDLEAQDDDLALKQTIAKALNIDPMFINAVAFSTNIRDYVVEISDALVLEGCKPDFNYMKAMATEGRYKHEGLMVTSKSNDADWDIKVRVFLPRTGVNEDIACGSGNCSIIPYWFEKEFNPNDGSYRAVFPYPDDASNLGGVQFVTFNPQTRRITISCEATTAGILPLRLDAANYQPCAQPPVLIKRG